MEERTQSSQLLESPSQKTKSLLQKIKMQLAQTAMFRGAKPEAAMITLYSERLAAESFEDVIAALTKIQETPREEGELALPEIGAMLKAVAVMKSIRVARERAALNLQFVAWKCPACSVTCSGFLSPGSHELRYCQASPHKSLHASGEICGTSMNVVYRGAP